jgi:hypothetical protein
LARRFDALICRTSWRKIVLDLQLADLCVKLLDLARRRRLGIHAAFGSNARAAWSKSCFFQIWFG